jgi:hypothetical protein
MTADEKEPTERTKCENAGTWHWIRSDDHLAANFAAAKVRRSVQVYIPAFVQEISLVRLYDRG